jgi:hypothetical protein
MCFCSSCGVTLGVYAQLPGCHVLYGAAALHLLPCQMLLVLSGFVFRMYSSA